MKMSIVLSLQAGLLQRGAQGADTIIQRRCSGRSTRRASGGPAASNAAGTFGRSSNLPGEYRARYFGGAVVIRAVRRAPGQKRKNGRAEPAWARRYRTASSRLGDGIVAWPLLRLGPVGVVAGVVVVVGGLQRLPVIEALPALARE